LEKISTSTSSTSFESAKGGEKESTMSI